jgi:hypothetical protein
MENFTMNKSEYDNFISNSDDLLGTVKKLISFTGTNNELLSDSQAIQKFIDIYFDTYHTKNRNELSEIRLNLYTLMGQAVIFWVGGKWKFCTLKKDEAFETPTILSWGGKDNRPRISPKVWEIIMIEDDDRKMFVNLLESLKEDYPK